MESQATGVMVRLGFLLETGGLCRAPLGNGPFLIVFLDVCLISSGKLGLLKVLCPCTAPPAVDKTL